MKWILIIWISNFPHLFLQEDEEVCNKVGVHLVKKHLIEEFRCSPIDKLT